MADITSQEMVDEGAEKRKLMIFGRNVAEIPCFRKAFLTGITSGIASSLVYFVFTSNTKKATKVGLFTFPIVTMATFTVCRYNLAVLRMEHRKLKNAIEHTRQTVKATDVQIQQTADINNTETNTYNDNKHEDPS
ncbi:unnamed protein product [Owenia fusiformis]|uniref:Cytochrome c oxidase assembly protein COX20, mitochondrial n=1 Tax=Owenia fusiformis TaxID=6347 RepID=A0A8S4PGU7_OWEFU|nr:unnamed protein product [Owenia fusiformis]